MVREDITEKVAFKQQTERKRGVNHANIRERMFQIERTAGARGLR